MLCKYTMCHSIFK